MLEYSPYPDSGAESTYEERPEQRDGYTAHGSTRHWTPRSRGGHARVDRRPDTSVNMTTIVEHDFTSQTPSRYHSSNFDVPTWWPNGTRTAAWSDEAMNVRDHIHHKNE